MDLASAKPSVDSMASAHLAQFVNTESTYFRVEIHVWHGET